MRMLTIAAATIVLAMGSAMGGEAKAGRSATAWELVAVPERREWGDVIITCGEAEVGPIQVFLASLFR